MMMPEDRDIFDSKKREEKKTEVHAHVSSNSIITRRGKYCAREWAIGPVLSPHHALGLVRKK
jgi:hypothetical protein